MALWSLHCGTLDLRLDADSACPHDTCMALYDALKLWRGNVALADLRFVRQPDAEYRLVLNHEDGRRWVQILRFGVPPSADPPMTFAVGDAWRLSEFQHGRPVRDLLVLLVATCGLASCEVEFTP